MFRNLPEEIYHVMTNRLNEVMEDLIEVSQLVDRGDDDFKNWHQILISECARFHLGEWAIKEPRHPKGLIAELKKQHKKLHHVRSGLANLPEQYARSTWQNHFNFEPLAKFGNSPVDIFEGFFTSVHDLLSYSSVSLSMHIAQAVRESPNDRRTSPKTDFADEMIYLFQRANYENEISSSPTSRFADFFSLSYYVATGEEGMFLERPVKTAIADIRSECGSFLHPRLYTKYISDEKQREIEEIWPDQVTKIKQFDASFTQEDDDKSDDSIFRRIQIQDAKWVLNNIPTPSGMDRYILDQLIEAGLRALKYPTDQEREEIAKYDSIRDKTSPPSEFD